MFEYKIIRSKRKTLALQINSEGEIIVRSPERVSEKRIAKFVEANSEWIEKNHKKISDRKADRVEMTDDDIKKLKKLAKEYLPPKVEYYAKLMNVNYTNIKITSAKTRFGSCSGKNSICFSYILMLYPEKAIDYVVIHELAHTVHHNHSRDFYNFISQFMPDYKSAEKMLKGPQYLPY